MLGLRRFLLGIVSARPRGLRSRLRRRLRARLGASDVPLQSEPAAPSPSFVADGVDRDAARATASDDGFVDVLSEAELGDDLVEVLAAGRSVVLARRGGDVVAFDGVCPHAGGPLADGVLDGATIICPTHGWTFDVDTGACHFDPDLHLGLWEVRARDGRIAVRPRVRDDRA